MGVTHYEFGPFRLDVNERMLFRDGKVIDLIPKAIDLLLLLVQNRPKLLSKDTILEAVWPGVSVEPGNIPHNISLIRKTLGERPGSATYIETRPKRGYRFIAHVREILEEDYQPTRALTRHESRTALGSVVGFHRIRSIAVLPLLDLSGDADDDHFSGGLTEALIEALSKLTDMRVLPLSSVRQFKGQVDNFRQIGHQLSVDAALIGSVRNEHGAVNILVSLFHMASGAQLFSEAYDRDVRDIAAIQQDIVRRIIGSLDLTLAADSGEQTRAIHYPHNSAAYLDYLKARHQTNKRTLDGVHRAIEHLEAALGNDPLYAPAWAGLSEAFGLLGVYNILPPRDAFAKMKAAANKAIEIEPDSAEARTSLGIVKFWHEWDAFSAEAQFQRALNCNPKYAPAWQWYSEMLSLCGRHDEALERITQARELEPLSSIIGSLVALAHFYAGDLNGAVQEVNHVLESSPNFPIAHFFRGYVLEQQLLYAEAIAAFRRAIELSGGRGLRYLGHALAKAGQRDEAIRILNELTLRSRTGAYVPAVDFALIYTGLGDCDNAFQWLDRMREERSNWLIYLNVDPRFDCLSSDPRFKQLLTLAGLLANKRPYIRRRERGEELN